MIKHQTETDKDCLEYENHREQNRVGLNQDRHLFAFPTVAAVDNA